MARAAEPQLVTATVREWQAEEGWGVVDSPRTPGGCWVHWSVVRSPGYRALAPGQVVRIAWEAAVQDGYDFRATTVVLD